MNEKTKEKIGETELGKDFLEAWNIIEYIFVDANTVTISAVNMKMPKLYLFGKIWEGLNQETKMVLKEELGDEEYLKLIDIIDTINK